MIVYKPLAHRVRNPLPARDRCGAWRFSPARFPAAKVSFWATAAPVVTCRWHDPQLLSLIVAISGLSALDSGFTLLLLSSGAALELNPFMQLLIEHDVRLFVAVKGLITGAGLVFLAAAMKYRSRQPARLSAVLQTICALYVTLIVYEVHLIEGL
jgi:hypothetical protein